MLTIKVNTIDSSRVYISDVVEISRPGQRVFESIVQRAKENGAVCPGIVFELGFASVDESNKAEIHNHDVVINESCRDPKDSTLIGVLLSTNKDENNDELCYEFIYSGDSVYIMNESGKTVEVLK